MKSTIVVLLAVTITTPALADPQLTSWFTTNSAQYARIRASTGATPATIWTGQTLPAYSDVQTVMYSANYVYVYASGLASHIMGPWYLNAAKTQLFPNKPTNQKVTMRFPRVPATATNTHTSTPGGAMGMYVNGVAMFNMLDGYAYNTSSSSDQQGMIGSGIWERDAYFGEIATFDPANAHQPGSGQYHMHINPIALRYQLADNATYSAVSDSYSEYTNSLHHSPILGWAFDGYPIYGPYGYSDPNSATAAVRRLVSGFIKRDGSYGTSNLNVTGRTTLPYWAQLAQNRANLTAAQYGPSTTKTADMTGSFALGRYAEDYDHLGDLPTNVTAGAQWDLDRYNGRFCVTPDYPQGTYAYFVTINTNGTPAYPYLLGRQFYGIASGGTVGSITESVTTNFTGGTNTAMVVTGISTSNTGDVTLTWSSVEGGTYIVDASTNLTNWSDLSPSVTATAIAAQSTESGVAQTYNQRFYKVKLSSVASFDP